MTNPYAPPTSALETSPSGTPRRGWWKAFFWLNVALTPFIVLGASMAKHLTWLDFLDMFAYAWLLLSFYGYAYGKRLFHPGAWRAFSIAYPVWCAIYSVILPFGFGFENYGQKQEFDGLFAFSVVMFLLSAGCLYLYAFRSPTIWGTQAE